eukprot:6443870-Alexandrium_andersonii.AAC.1
MGQTALSAARSRRSSEPPTLRVSGAGGAALRAALPPPRSAGRRVPTPLPRTSNCLNGEEGQQRAG